jgi:hypothetical protein
MSSEDKKCNKEKQCTSKEKWQKNLHGATGGRHFAAWLVSGNDGLAARSSVGNSDPSLQIEAIDREKGRANGFVD